MERSTKHLIALVVVGVVVLTPAAITAQQGATSVSVGAGTATDERGMRSNAVSLAPTVTLFSTRNVDLLLGGTATRFEASAWQVGGAVTVAARSGKARGTSISLNAGGGVSQSSFGTTFTVADATPAIEFSVGPMTVFGGGRVAAARTSVRTAPTPLTPPGQKSVTAATRTSTAPVYGAQWAFGGFGSPVSGAVSYRGERAKVSSEVVVDQTGGATIAFGRVTLGGTYGDRASPSERARFATGSVSIGLSRDVTLESAAGQYPTNRLTGTAAGRFVSAGFSFRFGAGAPELPAPSGVRAPAGGATRLSIRVPDAKSVELFGDWNDWTPVAARRAANGVWFVDLSLEPGEYRYAFRINESEWRVPEGAASTRDGFGGKSAYVTVPRGVAHVGSTSREER
jgi:hypothetical protein